MSFVETKRKCRCRHVEKGTVRPRKTVRDSHQQDRPPQSPLPRSGRRLTGQPRGARRCHGRRQVGGLSRRRRRPRARRSVESVESRQFAVVAVQRRRRRVWISPPRRTLRRWSANRLHLAFQDHDVPLGLSLTPASCRYDDVGDFGVGSLSSGCASVRSVHA